MEQKQRKYQDINPLWCVDPAGRHINFVLQMTKSISNSLRKRNGTGGIVDLRMAKSEERCLVWRLSPD